MSERPVIDKDYEDNDPYSASASPVELPEQQYTRQELVEISDSPASRRRPSCLDRIFDTKEGRWDPEQWWFANFGSRETSPLTLGDGKERRRIVELDRDSKRRPSANDPIERLKEERDGIVLSPQRRSFVTGCHVQASSIPYSRQLSLPERDREDSRVERDRDRERDRGERERDRPLRKIGSGRIQIDREGTRDFSNLRDRFEDRERERDRDRDHPWSRDRGDRDREWERDRDPRDSEWDRERDRDRRYDRDRSDRYRRDNQYSDRDRRDRDYRDRDRDRGFDRSGRRRNNYSREEEPEWFTGGPTSQMDTIELRGFETENHKSPSDHKITRDNQQPEEDSEFDKLNKESNENDAQLASESPHESYHTGDELDRPKSSHSHLVSHPLQDQHLRSMTPQQPQHQMRVSPSVPGVKHFDLEEILKAHLPLGDEGEVQGSRFSRFFTGPAGNMIRSPASSLEDILMPHDLLEDNHPSPVIPSPSSHNYGHLSDLLPRHHIQDGVMDYGEIMKDSSIVHIPGCSGPMPNQAGDNNAGKMKPTLPAPVSALFNSAMAGGANASMSSNGSFSSQDAEAQLKAMLFGGGHRESESSSGTASPASLKLNPSKRVKTLAEVEADMHQYSLMKSASPVQVDATSGGGQKTGDLAAFNKLLTLISAASETTPNMPSSQSVSGMPTTYGGYIPSNSEFAYALKRNKEQQMLLQQSSQPQASMQCQRPEMSQGLPSGRLPYPVNDPVFAVTKPAGGIPRPPQATSTPIVQPNTASNPKIQPVSNNPSSDPIFNLIQQNPSIVMKPTPPSPSVAALITSQQPAVATAANARIPSPLLFSQQPPLHLSAPSPINPTQLGPGPHISPSLAANALPSSSVSPARRVLSPQSIAMHTQAVMQNALIKKHLQNQNERYIKKQLERTKSPSHQQHINVVKPQPAAQPVLPPNPQPKGATLDTFTPTSVLRKMHSDRAMEKEKYSQEGENEEPLDYMPSMQEFSAVRHTLDTHSNTDYMSMDNDGHAHDSKDIRDASDISFLNPVNPNLVNLSNQLENSLKLNAGQINILPGSLSQPMSVEEKIKLSSLVEKRGILSQILESKAAVEESAKINNKMAGMQGRPIVRGSDKMSEENFVLQNFQQQQNLIMQQQQQQQQNSHHLQQPHHHQHLMQHIPGARAVTGGGGAKIKGHYGPMVPNTPPPPPHIPPSQPNIKGASGRAIVGSSSILQQPQPPLGVPTGPPPPVGTALTPEMMRMLDQHKQQHQQFQHFQLAQPPPLQGPMAVPPPLPGPIPYGVPLGTRMPMSGVPVHSAASAAMMQHQIVRDGPILPTPVGINGNSPKAEIGTSIQRWFSADILKNQLPSMPPLPTQGSHVLTVDELERN